MEESKDPEVDTSKDNSSDNDGVEKHQSLKIRNTKGRSFWVIR